MGDASSFTSFQRSSALAAGAVASLSRVGGHSTFATTQKRGSLFNNPRPSSVPTGIAPSKAPTIPILEYRDKLEDEGPVKDKLLDEAVGEVVDESQKDFFPVLSNTILLSFDVDGITGTQPITYSIIYGTDGINFPNTFTDVMQLEYKIGLSTNYIASIPSINFRSGTDYYFKSVATNIAGSKISGSSPAYRVEGNGGGSSKLVAPGIPVVLSITYNSINVGFDVSPTLDTGTGTVIYSIEYGTDDITFGNTEILGSYTEGGFDLDNPKQPVDAFLPGTITQQVPRKPNIMGTSMSINITGLDPNTTYYFRSVARDSLPSTEKSLSVAFKTLPIPTPPSGAPIPQSLNITANGFVGVSIDTTDITGTQPITYEIKMSTDGLTFGNIYENLINIGNGIFHLVISVSTPGASYYFKSVAISSGLEVLSESSVGIMPGTQQAIPLVAAGVPVLIGNPTETTMRIEVDVTNSIGTGIGFIRYFLSYRPESESYQSVRLDNDPARSNIYYKDLTGLMPDTNYYFESQTIDDAGSGEKATEAGPFRTLAGINLP